MPPEAMDCTTSPPSPPAMAMSCAAVRVSVTGARPLATNRGAAGPAPIAPPWDTSVTIGALMVPGTALANGAKPVAFVLLTMLPVAIKLAEVAALTAPMLSAPCWLIQRPSVRAAAKSGVASSIPRAAVSEPIACCADSAMLLAKMSAEPACCKMLPPAVVTVTEPSGSSMKPVKAILASVVVVPGLVLVMVITVGTSCAWMV